MTKKTREEMVAAIIENDMYTLTGSEAMTELENIWRNGYCLKPLNQMTDEEVEAEYRNVLEEENRSE
jgi:hypothetical protein